MRKPLRLLPFGLAVAVLVNLGLLCLFLLGDEGQTTVVELRNDGGAFRAFTDGTQVVPGGADLRPAAELNAPERGTIVLVVAPPVPTLHPVAGIDSISVIGRNGELLFRDTFEGLDEATWEVLEGAFEVRDGLLTATAAGRDNVLLLRREGWSEYSVRVAYRNTRAGVIGVNITSDGGLYYHFDLVRDFPAFFHVLNEGAGQPGASGSLMRTDVAGPLRSTAIMLSRGYPYWVAAALAGVVLVFALSAGHPYAARAHGVSPRVPLDAQRLQYLVVALFAMAAAGLTFYLNLVYYGLIPHLPDEVAYLFQAEVLARLQVTAEAPPVREAFYFYMPPSLYEHGDRWASFYPFGHPLILALAVPFGAVKIVPSLVGAACIVLTFLIGRRLFDARTGLVAAGLLLASPFFLMQASSFMSHNTGAFYILLALYFILRRDRPLLFGILAGFFFGLGINTRLLTMVALTPVFGALMLGFLWPWARVYLEQRRGRQAAAAQPAVGVDREQFFRWLLHTLGFVAAALLMSIALLLYNYGLTGDPLTSPYTGTQGTSGQLFGFREGHTLDIGLRNLQAQLMALLMVLNGWPAWAALAFVLLPFLLGTRHPHDYLLAGAVLLPVLIYIGYRYSGIYEGPRYWYETAPFLVLLAARGAAIASERLAFAAAWLRDRIRRGPLPRRWAATAIVYTALAVLVVYGSGGWLLGWHAEEDAPLIPQSAAGKEGLFDVDGRLDSLADDLELENALVLVRPCGFFGSLSCYGTVFLRNLPDFDGPVVWARYDEALNPRTIAAFPGRSVHVVTWSPLSIEPYAE